MIISDLSIERSLWQKGYKHIVGIDEVGRGSWAGPLVAAGVIFPPNVTLPPNLKDSKLLRHAQRVKIAQLIKSKALGISIVEITPRKLDRILLAKATHLAFRKVIRSIIPEPDYCLIDAFYVKHYPKTKQLAVKNGDKICASISAASVIAKVYRDDLMKKIHRIYPAYSFGCHKGYGTKQHQDAIRAYGFTKIHRKSFNLDYLTS